MVNKTTLISVVATALMALSMGANAAGGGGFALHADNDVGNINSLQRGARNFFNYCAGCHSAKYVRYSRIAEDLELSEDMVLENFMFGQGKVGHTVSAAMTDEHAEQWFGAVPPDLSLTGRSKGADWIYSFLMAFYADPSRELGVNNLVLVGAAMPHVLADLQGLRGLKGADDHHGEDHEDAGHGDDSSPLVQLTEGSLTPVEYEEFVRDTVNFLDYIGEPMQMQRRSLGIKVLAYLVLLFVLAYALKQEFWKDIH